MGVSVYRVREVLGDRLKVRVDPGRIDHYVDGKVVTAKYRRIVRRVFARLPLQAEGGGGVGNLQKLYRIAINGVLRLEPFVIEDRYYGSIRYVVESEKYARIADLITNRQNFERSLWFARLMQDLEREGVARHKELLMHSREDVIRFFEEYVLDLMHSMEADGYREDKTADVGTALVGADGSLHKSSGGNHRFCFARTLGVASIPLRVDGVHIDWVRHRFGSGKGLKPEKLAFALRELESSHQR